MRPVFQSLFSLRSAAWLVVGLGLVFGGLASDARAQDTGAAATLEQRTFDNLGCTIAVPADWDQSIEDDRVRFKLDEKGGAGLLRVWRTRKSLVSIKNGLKGRATKEGWTEVATNDLQVDERDAFLMTCVAAVKNKDATVTNLFFVVDAPAATYLLHVGALTDRFDLEAMTAVADSFKLIVAPEPAPEEGAPEAPDDDGFDIPEDGATETPPADGAATSTPSAPEEDPDGDE